MRADGVREGTEREGQHPDREAARERRARLGLVDGRPRGHVGEYGISRVRFRAMAHRGELPGVTKSSW